MDDVADRLIAFFHEADQLTPVQVAALIVAARGRTLGHLDLETEPAFLLAVSGGEWTHHHSVMARRIHLASRASAHRLTSWRHRRAVAGALENAALVVLATHGPSSLPPDLLDRMGGAWRSVTGSPPEPLAGVA